jgi:hypothetical protein
VTGPRGLRVTRLTEADIPELIRLKAQVYGAGLAESPEDYLWKFFANPHRSAGVPYWMLREQDRLVGGIGALPVRMRFFGRDIAAEFACDLFIERGRQRSGLGSVLMDAYIADSPWPLMMNASPSAHRFLVKRGFHDLSPGVHLHVRPLRPGALLASRWGGWRGKAAVAADPFLRAGLGLRAALRRGRVDRAIRVEEVSAFGPWAEEIWNAAGGDYAVVVVRDAAYLRWKYERHPRRSYRILKATQAGRPIAYATFRIRRTPEQTLAIVQEIFARRDASAARDALLRHVVAAARTAGAHAVKGLATDPGVLADLRRAGFLDTGRSPGFLYPVQPGFDRPELKEAGTWYLTGGDSDLDYEASASRG